MDGKSIYTLPVIENGKPGLYHCVFNAISDYIPAFNWFLLKGKNILSQGVCGEEDMITMLQVLRSDLKGIEDWYEEIIH